jgi:hypothetical protein
MKATISFGNPVAGTAFTVAVLLIGWWIGARWGHAYGRMDASFRNDFSDSA